MFGDQLDEFGARAAAKFALANEDFVFVHAVLPHGFEERGRFFRMKGHYVLSPIVDSYI